MRATASPSHPADRAARRRFPERALPPRAGAGLKDEHVDAILADPFRIGFLEVHAQSYMDAGGPAHPALMAIRERFPISVHGVGLSIGGERGLDPVHLDRLADVVARYQPGMVSEHLAWSSHSDVYYNDLLPLPYDRRMLDRVVAHVGAVQDRLKRKILIENPAMHVAFEQATMGETDFIREVAQRSGCGLLLNVDNVLVSAANLGWKPMSYLKDFPLELVEEIHLAGHAEDEGDEGDLPFVDAHGRPVSDVWKLYDVVISQIGAVPTLIECDNDVPEWPVLRREAQAADRILAARGATSWLGSRHATA